MPAFDPRDRNEVGAAKGNAGYGGGGNRSGGFGGGMGGLNARRSVNPTPSYEMNLHNMMTLGGMLPGPGMALKAGLGLSGFGPQFTGPRGTVNGPGDYDPSNRFGTMDSNMFRPKQGKQGMPGIQAAGQRPVAPANPLLQQLQMPAQQLNIPGPSQYGVNLPAYGYFGTPPAQQRPLMFGQQPMQAAGNPGIRPGTRVMPYR